LAKKETHITEGSGVPKNKHSLSKPPSKREIAKAERETLIKKMKLLLINHNIFVFNRKTDKEKEKIHKKGKEPQRFMSDEDAEEQVYELFWKTKKTKPIMITILKWVIILGIFFAAAYYWTYVQNYILGLLGKNTTVWQAYEHIIWHISNRSLLGLFYFTFFGNLFFLSLPDEIIFILYLGLGFPLVHVIAIALVANILGMIINYFLGCLISKKLIKKILKHKYTDYSIKMKHNGWMIILFGNIFPSPIQLVSVMFGSMRYGFWRFLLYTVMGKICKFTAMFYGYSYYMSMVSPMVEQSVNPAAECMSKCMGDTNISKIFTK